jgi:hypothetical protein
MNISSSIILCPFLTATLGLAAEPAIKTQPAKNDNATPNANGTDPTSPINRLQGTAEFTDLNHGHAISVIGRADYVLPDQPDVAIRADVPITQVSYRDENKFGLADIYAEGLKILPIPDKRFTAAAALGIILPTASHDILGSGKWQLAPKVVGAMHIEGDRSLVYAQIQDFFSVSGDNDRPDLHYIEISAAFRHNLDKGVWILAGLMDRHDWKYDIHDDLTGRLEGGILFEPRKAAWIDLTFPIGDHHSLDFALSGTVMLRY